MIVLAILFAGVAVLGAFVGLEHVGQPIGGQSITAYAGASVSTRLRSLPF
jgi:hypothetical protein